jgi:hypothetical protein
LQRLRKIARPRLHLVEQADILDRDDGLVGEGLHDSDLAFGKETRFETPEHEYSLDASFAQQRQTEQSARGAELPILRSKVVFGVLRNVGNLFDIA